MINRKSKIVNLKLIILMAFFSMSHLVSASVIEYVFVNMPEEYYLFQTAEQRSELLKSHNRNDTTGVKNRFGGKSYILQLDGTNEYLLVRNTKISTVEMKIWTLNNGEQIAGINIVTCTPLCDSQLAFFNQKWQHVKNIFFPDVNLTDFLDTKKILDDNKTTEEIAAAFDIVFFHYSFSKTGTNIEVELLIDKNISEEAFARLEPYLLTKKIVFVWNGTQFVR